jgi:hypothetical protein
MTVLDAISTLPFEIDANLAEKILLDAGLSGNVIYTPSLVREVDLCMAEICRITLAKPDVTEGELSIRIDRPAIAELRNATLKKYDLAEGGITGDHSANPLW